MAGEGRAHRSLVDVGADLDGAAGAAKLPGDLLEGELALLALAVVGAADDAVVAVGDLVGVALPDLGGALDHLAANLHAELVGGPATGEGRAAAGGEEVEADAVGVDDARPDLLGGDAEGLGELHRQRRAGAADVDGAEDEVDGAVGVDAGAGAGLAAGVAPVAHGDAAAAVLTLELGLVVRVVLHGFHDLATTPITAPVAAPGAWTLVLGGVLDADVHRVQCQGASQSSLITTSPGNSPAGVPGAR